MSSLAINGFTLTHQALHATQGTGIDPISRLCLSTLAGFCNAMAECWPSNQTIADRTGLHERTVSKAIGKLQEAGLIERHSRGYGRAMLTRLLLPTHPGPEATYPGPEATNEPATRNLLQIPRAANATTPAPAPAHIAVSPPFFEIEQPKQPIPEIESLPDYSAQLQVFANSQYAPTEATETTYSASNEADKAIHTLDPATPVVERQAEGTQGQAVDAIEADPKPTTIDTTQAEADQADPAMAAWAEVPAQVIADLQAIRLEKRKKKVPTKTEIQSWYSIALAEGWTLPQLAYALVLKNWSRVEPGWLQHVPRPQMTATGAPAAPTAPALWTPDQNHIPASPATVATWREKIAQMKQRWREEPLKARPMRQ